MERATLYTKKHTTKQINQNSAMTNKTTNKRSKTQTPVKTTDRKRNKVRKWKEGKNNITPTQINPKWNHDQQDNQQVK